VDEEALASIAATNGRFTSSLSAALSTLKSSVTGAPPDPSTPQDQPWTPLQDVVVALSASTNTTPAAVPPLPAGFPTEFSVPRNGQNLRDLFRRDAKEVQLHLKLPSSASSFLTFNIGLASIPLGLARLITKDPHYPGAPTPQGLIDPQTRATDRWQSWWHALSGWMKERKLNMAVVGTSFRDEKDKHRRELIIAYAPTTSLPTSFWPSFTKFLLDDAHVQDHSAPSAHSQRLMLEPDWKGDPLFPPRAQQTDPEVLRLTGKRERVGGLDPRTGKWDGGGDIFAVVWKQANDKANRKMFLPAITAAVQAVTSR